jgi:flagellar protein FliJ
MKRFQFRLGAVLKLRERAEDQRKQELAEVVRLRREHQDKHDSLQDSLDEQKQQMRDMAAGGDVNVERLIGYQRYAMSVDFQVRRLEETLRVIDEEMARRRGVLAEATRDKKVIEKLRERQHDEYLAGVAREERRELDEIGQFGHYRTRAEG